MPVFDPAKAKVKFSFTHPGTIYSLAVDQTAQRFYAGSDDYGIHVYDLAAAKKEAITHWSKHDNYVSALLCLKRANKTLVISGSYDRQLIWWDVASGQPQRTIAAHEGWIRDLAATPDGHLLVSAGDDMLVKLWGTDTGKLVRTLEGHTRRTPQGHVTALYAVAVSPDGKFLASGDRIGDVRIWETGTGKLVQSLAVPIVYTYDPKQRKRSLGGIRALAFSADGKQLAVGGMGEVNNVDGLAGPAHVEVWDWQKPERRFAAGVQGHKGLVNALQFHPTLPWLLGAGGGGDGGFLAFWKTDATSDPKEKKDAVPVLRSKTDGHVHRLVLKPDGSELVAAGYRKVEVWSVMG